MWVHRLLDVFFRTLDTVDAARDRVDRLLGREPRVDPWSVEWPPPDLERPVGDSGSRSTERGARAARQNGRAAAPDLEDEQTSRERKSTRTGSERRPGAARKTKRTSASSRRKGSVDRSGKDFDSPRARAVYEHVRERKIGVVREDAVLDGKKVLARVVWALYAAEQAGSEKGLTTADASALLYLARGLEVFSTNIGRACRDHPELILESVPDGRTKRYRLTDEGRARAKDLPVTSP